MNTPAAIPTPIASPTRARPSTLVSGSLVPGEPSLELREGEVLLVHRPVGFAREVDGGRSSVDQRREVRAYRWRQLRGVTEVGRDVGEVLDRIRVIALAQERAGDPGAVPRELREVGSTVANGATEVGEVAVLV